MTARTRNRRGRNSSLDFDEFVLQSEWLCAGGNNDEADDKRFVYFPNTF